MQWQPCKKHVRTAQQYSRMDSEVSTAAMPRATCACYPTCQPPAYQHERMPCKCR
jgi:hypothetical protein